MSQNSKRKKKNAKIVDSIGTITVSVEISTEQSSFLDKEVMNMNLRYPGLDFTRSDIVRVLIEQHRIRRALDEYYIEDPRILRVDSEKEPLENA